MVRTGSIALLASLMAWPAGAQGLDKDAIVDRLGPRQPLTRGIGAPSAPPRTRQIVIEPGQEDKVLAAVKEEKLPSLDIRVPFDYNSDVLTREAQAVLKPLCEALKDPKLAKARFLIGGHTDAKGSDDYNQSLSERRPLRPGARTWSRRSASTRRGCARWGWANAALPTRLGRRTASTGGWRSSTSAGDGAPLL
jgi:outer membrane protein OmpA-like peptidoglycan-associated protein